MRDKAAWLESVERWMARGNPPNGNLWFNRRLFYGGATRFHRELFSAAWDEYHEAVTRYFKGRDDLLVIDVAGTPEAELWEVLSRFVGRPAPDAAFPHLPCRQAGLNRSTK